MGGEAAARTSVNRCYYAAVHHAARVLPPEYGPFPTDHRFHGKVADAIYDAMGTKGLYDKIITLRENRRQADYDINDTFPEYLPQDSADLASEIVGTLSARFGG